jgi:hypothetical protein
VLLDLGSGALGSLQRFVDPLTLDAVLVSHLHPDHYFDNHGSLRAVEVPPDGRPPIPSPVSAQGASRSRPRASTACARSPGMSACSSSSTIRRQPIELGPPLSVTPRVVHRSRLRIGRASRERRACCATPGDTGPCRELVDLRRRRGPAARRAAFVAGRGTTRPTCTSPASQAGAGPQRRGGGRSGWCYTHIHPALADPRRPARPRRASSYGRVRLEGRAAPGRRTRSDGGS